MKITSISYQAVRNLGNYESERLEATADVEEGEDLANAVIKLRQFVHFQLLECPESLFESPGQLRSVGGSDSDIPEGF